MGLGRDFVQTQNNEPKGFNWADTILSVTDIFKRWLWTNSYFAEDKDDIDVNKIPWKDQHQKSQYFPVAQLWLWHSAEPTGSKWTK